MRVKKPDPKSAMVLSGLYDEIERQINAAQNIDELRAAVDEAVLKQTKEYALALFDDSRGMSEFATQLHMKTIGKLNGVLNEALGIDPWGKPDSRGLIGQVITKCVGEIVGGYVAEMMASPDIAERVRNYIATLLPKAVTSAMNYDTAREIERAAKDILQNRLFGDERK